MAIKASKEIRDFIYKLCNGLRREKDICDYLMCHHKEFIDSRETEIAVTYHLDKLKEQGLIHFKYDGRIIDLQR
tara:strand:+ start:114 stop:335 length:222 start_codon:yes stop_codon:yes gene_type:complete